MKIIKFKNLLEISIYILGIVFFIKATTIFNLSDSVENIIIAAVSLLLVIHIILSKYNLKSLIFCFALSALALYTTIVTKQSAILEMVLLIIAVRNYSIDRVIEIIYNLSKHLLIIHLLIYLILVLLGQQQIFTLYYGRIRASFGFVHPNLFSIYVFNIILMWLWINYEKLKTKNIILLFLLMTVIYLMTNTRTAYIIDIVVLIIILLSKKNKYPSATFTGFLFPIISLFMFMFSNLYNEGNNIVLIINNLLSGRIKLGAYALSNYGITLLGQNVNFSNITWDPQWELNSFTFDSLYTYLIFCIGVVWLLIIIFFVYKLSKKSEKSRIFILVFILYSITEIHPLNCFYLFPILLFSTIGEKSKILSLKGENE